MHLRQRCALVRHSAGRLEVVQPFPQWGPFRRHLPSVILANDGPFHATIQVDGNNSVLTVHCGEQSVEVAIAIAALDRKYGLMQSASIPE